MTPRTCRRQIVGGTAFVYVSQLQRMFFDQRGSYR